MGARDCETIIKNAIGLKWSVGRTAQWQNPRVPGVAGMWCAEDSPLWHKSATAQGLLCTAAKPLLPGTEEKTSANETRCNPLFLSTIPYPTWVSTENSGKKQKTNKIKKKNLCYSDYSPNRSTQETAFLSTNAWSHKRKHSLQVAYLINSYPKRPGRNCVHGAGCPVPAASSAPTMSLLVSQTQIFARSRGEVLNLWLPTTKPLFQHFLPEGQHWAATGTTLPTLLFPFCCASGELLPSNPRGLFCCSSSDLCFTSTNLLLF